MSGGTDVLVNCVDAVELVGNRPRRDLRESSAPERETSEQSSMQSRVVCSEAAG